MKLSFKFFRWRVYFRVVRDKAPEWLEQMVLDTFLYGEGIVRVGPEEVRVAAPFAQTPGGPFYGHDITEHLAKE